MEKWYVADSYKGMEQISDVFENEKGKKYIKVKGKCDRCGGLGIIVARVENGQLIPIPVDGGVCYKCGGSGYEIKKIRAYTENEYNALQRSKERAKKIREEAAAAREEEAMKNAEKYKHEVALKLGFGEDEKIYVVYGEDTFRIKDQLKEMGARFDPTFKWFFSKETELPEGYELCAFSFDELYEYNIKSRFATLKDNAREIVIQKLKQLQPQIASEFYPGKEKERIRNIKAKVKSIFSFEGIYGYTMVYTFISKNYVFVWMTAKGLDINIGDNVDLTGTIKKFEEYNGTNNTYLTRCVVKII